MKKFTKFIFVIVFLALWSYLTLVISAQVRIDQCLDAGGSWDQTHRECIYIDKDYFLQRIEQYQLNKISADELLNDLKERLGQQFNINAPEALLMIQSLDILSTAESLSPEIAERAKNIFVDREIQ